MKGQSFIAIIIILIVFAAIGGTYYVTQKRATTTTSTTIEPTTTSSTTIQTTTTTTITTTSITTSTVPECTNYKDCCNLYSVEGWWLCDNGKCSSCTPEAAEYFGCKYCYPPTVTTVYTIPRSEALNLANNHIKSKCPNVDYTWINKDPWNIGGMLMLFLKEICPDVEEYNYTEIYATEEYLNATECSLPYPEGSNCITVYTFIGLDGQFKCSYGLTKYAAPGIVNLDNFC